MNSRIPEGDAARVFPAVLSPRYRLFSLTVGYGTGFVLPALIGIAAAFYGRYWALALPLPFLLLIGLASLFRPRAFCIADDRIAVLRSIGAVEWPLTEISAVRVPPVWPRSRSVALLATRGLFGAYGWFWHREWGAHRVYLTDPDEAVEIECRNGRRIVMTPAKHRDFVLALEEAARRAGVSISIERGR